MGDFWDARWQADLWVQFPLILCECSELCERGKDWQISCHLPSPTSPISLMAMYARARNSDVTLQGLWKTPDTSLSLSWRFTFDHGLVAMSLEAWCQIFGTTYTGQWNPSNGTTGACLYLNWHDRQRTSLCLPLQFDLVGICRWLWS